MGTRRFITSTRGPAKTAIRLVVSPDGPGRFSARLESTGEAIITGTRQPLVDGAREMLARGFDTAMPLTMRHEGKAYDSFQPLPIGQWARWTYTEGETTPLRCVRWMPRPDVGEGQKWGSEPSAVPEGHQTESRFRDGALPQGATVLGAASP
jgi:hypothetical protein